LKNAGLAIGHGAFHEQKFIQVIFRVDLASIRGSGGNQVSGFRETQAFVKSAIGLFDDSKQCSTQSKIGEGTK
jgi:hypothetical protein